MLDNVVGPASNNDRIKLVTNKMIEFAFASVLIIHMLYNCLNEYQYWEEYVVLCCVMVDISLISIAYPWEAAEWQ